MILQYISDKHHTLPLITSNINELVNLKMTQISWYPVQCLK